MGDASFCHPSNGTTRNSRQHVKMIEYEGHTEWKLPGICQTFSLNSWDLANSHSQRGTKWGWSYGHAYRITPHIQQEVKGTSITSCMSPSSSQFWKNDRKESTVVFFFVFCWVMAICYYKYRQLEIITTPLLLSSGSWQLKFGLVALYSEAQEVYSGSFHVKKCSLRIALQIFNPNWWFLANQKLGPTWWFKCHLHLSQEHEILW